MGETILQKLFGRRRHRRIFISYRRHGDGAGYGGRMADSLVEYFGRDQCFLDVEHIAPGQDFVQTISEGIGACEVLVVVIGPDWITQTDRTGRPRLEDPNDFVRIEVAAALKRNVRVIPVLVGGAQIPAEEQLPEDLKALTRRQVLELSDSRWSYDTRVLLQAIENAGIRSLAASGQVALRQRIKSVAVAGIAAGLVLSTVFAVTYKPWQKTDPPTIVPDKPVSAPAQPTDSATAQAAIQALERARKDSEAQTKAALEEKDRLAQRLYQSEKEKEAAARQAEQDRQAKRRAEALAALNRPQPVPSPPTVPAAPAAPAAPARPCGIAAISWRHDNTIHDAILRMSGSQGSAVVEYRDLSGAFHKVEQDIYAVRTADFTYFEGSKPRSYGTNRLHPNFAPDIFRLERLSNGAWRVKDVGVVLLRDHFDIAVPGTVSTLADCK